MSKSLVRILVWAPAVGPGSADPGTVAALQQLGRDARIELVHTAGLASARAAGGDFDLIVVDGRVWAAGALPVAAGEGPPVIVVGPRGGEQGVLAAFRAGAADCITTGDDYAQLLPVAALEQIQRWRASCERDAAEALERQVEDLRRYNENIIQNMDSALLVVGLEGGIRFANRTAEGILGASLESLQQSGIERYLEDPELIRGTVVRGTRQRGAETVICRPDGRRVPIGISCSPLLDGDGERRGAVAIFQDLTEIKQLQRQVLQTEKMASIGQLAAGVAHEINNPMGFIHANLFQLNEYLEELSRVWEGVDALRKAVAVGGPEAQRVEAELAATIEEVDADFLLTDCGKAVRESLEGAERVRHIVQDLRAFSRQDTDDRIEGDVNQALDSTANIVWTMMKHSVVLTKEYRELPLVRCYPMQLKQVFMNLLVNAYQAIEERPGGDGARGEIRLETRALEDGVRVRVIDNGVGVPVEHRDRIFDPFFTTKEVGVGTGLGLSTSYNIIERHGGRLTVTSEPGSGSTFEIFLPLGTDSLGTDRGTGSASA